MDLWQEINVDAECSFVSYGTVLLIFGTRMFWFTYCTKLAMKGCWCIRLPSLTYEFEYVPAHTRWASGSYQYFGVSPNVMR
jgi:hypothetical protein